MSSTAPAAERTGDRRWLALGLIAAAQFMVIMDTSIIGVALPEMQQDLGFDPQNLSWVFNAYVVAFGGLLLLGGRHGRTRTPCCSAGTFPDRTSWPGTPSAACTCSRSPPATPTRSPARC